MIKWLRRLILYPLLAIILLTVIFFAFNKTLYHSLKGFYAVQLQWFGYEEKGNDILEGALENIKNADAQLYHAYSVQNTKNGNYDEAIKYLNTAAELDPLNADGYFGWSLLYYYRDYEKALFHLNRLDSTTNFIDYVGDDNILFAKGLCYKQQHNYSKALELFKAALDHEIKEHSEAWITHQMLFQTGRTLHELNRLKEAIEFYNQAIDKWDGSSESIYYKGLAELTLGIETGCENLDLALVNVIKGIKSSDSYVRLFDEIYIGQVEEMIQLKCQN